MTDAYIESAMMALTATWSETGNGMSITCPQMSECLSMLSRQVRTLYDEQIVQRRLIERHQETIQNLNEEVELYRSRMRETTRTLDDLTSESTGFVRYSVFSELAQKVVEKPTVSAMKDEIKKLQIQHGGTASRREFEELQREMRALTMTVEEHRREIIDETGSIRKVGAQSEADVRKQIAECFAKVSQVDADLCRRMDRLSVDNEHEMGQLNNSLTLTQTKHADSLERHAQEIVQHLRRHAEAIEALQTERNERNRRIPTQQEVAQLRSDMDAVKNDITEALFRVQEVYSQCQAMYTTARSVPVYGQSALSGGTGGTERGTLLSEAENVLSSIQAASGLAREAIPSSTELQVSMLKRDVHRVATIALPSCIAQVQQLKDQVDALARMSTRAAETFKGFCESLGLEDGGDELLAALQQQDYNKSILNLRAALSTLAAGGYNYPSPSRGFRKGTASGMNSPTKPPLQAANVSSTSIPGSSTPGSTANAKEGGFETPEQQLPPKVGQSYDERYTMLPRLAALKSDKFSISSAGAKKAAPTLGLDCADNIGADGIQVMHVVSGSAAFRAGLCKGETIIALNDRPVRNCAEFLHVLSTNFLHSEGKVRCKVVDSSGAARDVRIDYNS